MERLPYRELVVWQKAHALALEVLDLGDRPEIARRFYFRDQLCSAAMSVPANIAEGNGRGTPRDYASFIDRARGSLFELDTWLVTAAAKAYITPHELERLSVQIREVNALAFALRQSLRAKASREQRRAKR